MGLPRAQRDERPDQGLIDRHRRDDLPAASATLALRWFSVVPRLTAIERGSGVDDVFVFANRADHVPPNTCGRRSLVVYLNRYRALMFVSRRRGDPWPSSDDPRASSSFATSGPGSTSWRRTSDMRETASALARRLCLPRFPVSPRSATARWRGWANLGRDIRPRRCSGCAIALRKSRDRRSEAMAALFATRVAEEAFLPFRADRDTHVGADAARAAFGAAIDRVGQGRIYG